ncbi:MAG: ABC transporter ATP-binding protein [Actinobacteria bacterium]|nr:ABC transporter ATP-binding protein [Actinomycetota bacterium]
MLEIKSLEAGYGRIGVLWDIDLTVGEQEIVALVGSNGAGKTTLLRAVSGVIAPTKGSIVFEGRDLSGLVPEQVVRRGIAHVPEGRRLFAGLTVRENLKLGAFHLKDSASADFDRVVELFPRLGERLDQIAGSLSGGEQQMCAIGRGLMSRPKLIMIDELSLGLAPNLVDQLLERLETIRSEGMSVLLVEQDVDAALTLAERAYVLETGQIALEGSGDELLFDKRVREAYLGVA